MVIARSSFHLKTRAGDHSGDLIRITIFIVSHRGSERAARLRNRSLFVFLRRFPCVDVGAAREPRGRERLDLCRENVYARLFMNGAMCAR